MTNVNDRGIWVFAEQTDGVLCPTVPELLAKAVAENAPELAPKHQHCKRVEFLREDHKIFR